MKALSLFLLCACLLIPGCKTVSAPLPTNAVNGIDAGVNETLQAAHTGAAQFAANVQSGKFTATPAEKAAYNAVANALNVADPIYQQWHAALVANPAAMEPQQLISALAIVTSNISSILNAVATLK